MNNYPEAFCLMTYRADDHSEKEVIWNSRDGVTPFVVTLRSGKTAHHVHWQNDILAVDYKPPVGSRIFVDLTEQRANEIATKLADTYWNDIPDSEKKWWQSPEDFAANIVASYLSDGAPDLIEVT